MKFDVLKRWSGKVQCTAEIDCSDDAPPAMKLGLAVKWAMSGYSFEPITAATK